MLSLEKMKRNVLFKGLSLCVAASFLGETFFPTVAMALTSGPTTPEVQSFEPMGTTDMVDLFSGDFTYNIPLMELPGPNGGYPFNLAYHSGIGMDQEATWVGLGWNLNPGVINRSMRGMPDDFNGDAIQKKMSIKDNWTAGLNVGGGVEVFGADSDAAIQLGLRVYYNSYKGVGYSLNPSFGYTPSDGGIGFGIGVSMDSQEGVGANASLSLSSEVNDAGKQKSGNIGVGINSQSGGSMSLGGDLTQWGKKPGSKMFDTKKGSNGGSSSISFTNPGFTPQISMPMSSYSIDIRIKTGGSIGGVFGNLSFGGFFSTQYLDGKGQTLNHAAYGYNYLENAGSKGLMDFNRHKDGIIRNESPNLPVPQLTYDYYNVMGQGTGGMYRPYRSDIGHVHDQRVDSRTYGGSFGADVGIPTHGGAQVTFTGGESWSGDWTSSNPWGGTYSFKDVKHYNGANNTLDYESVYYAAHGEYTSFKTDEMNDIGGEAAVRAILGGGGTAFTPGSLGGPGVTAIGSHRSHRSTATKGRMKRNMSVQPITVEQMGGGASVLGEYKVNYMVGASTIPLDRTAHSQQPHHIGGITSINQEGMRYVYGLPAMNTKDEEYIFSSPAAGPCDQKVNATEATYKQNQTNEYLSETKLPAYAYAYHLTSILGPDYVDIGNDGPDPKDLGYWVKFTYEQVHSNYGWRAPFTQANYIKGYEGAREDDKASYKYGEKEVYHLVKAETSTHEIVFDITNRNDGEGAKKAGGKSGQKSVQLNSMSLFAKGSATPIKTAHFDYNQFGETLCNGVENGSGGKLTLTSLWFTYQNNSRGELSKYGFEYSDNNHDGTKESNPGYDSNKYDRWGNYKGNASGCAAMELPYVDQTTTKSTMDEYMASWHLTQIYLPTGGKIRVTYEADDYAYVQHRKAMQMFEVTGIPGLTSTVQTEWKFEFNLEEPIPTAGADAEIKSRYLDGLKVNNKYQLYYKVKVRLRDNIYEYISGYADLDMTSGRYGGVAGSIVGGSYTKGFVTLKAMNINGNVNHHPVRVAAWQHMRTNQPQLFLTPGSLSGAPGSSTMAKAAKVKSLLSVWSSVQVAFAGYRSYAKSRGFADQADETKSVIRLCTPDGVKYGGGSRVKQIEMFDGWNEMSQNEVQSSYGQYYDYTMLENNEVISSGVASYEPAIGGDETALRYAKNYTQSIPVMTDNNLFFEFPVNEAYYPGASVGYRKVSVRSLATKQVMDATLPAAVPTTGLAVHEFYTAKDFPVVTNETDIQKEPYKLFIPIPLIGQMKTVHLTASQGYSIKLNDMHGKPKSVQYFGMDKDGNVMEMPVSSIEYIYKSDKLYMNDGSAAWANELVNEVEVMIPSVTEGRYGLGTKETRIMGVEYEMFHDMRQSKNTMTVGGVSVNLDVVIPILPIPTPWPNVVRDENELKTVTTNKIIHKAGILEKTIATDGESTVETYNSLYDHQTGKPILTVVNNNYGDPVYNYEVPAYWNYSGMASAATNYMVELQATVDTAYYGALKLSPIKNMSGDVIPDSKVHEILEGGDEFVITSYAGYSGLADRATLIGDYDLGAGGYEFRLYVDDNGTSLDYPIQNDVITMHLVRSGKRNNLSAISGTIIALQDPTGGLTGNEGVADYVIDPVPNDLPDLLNDNILGCNGKIVIDQSIKYELDSPEMFDNEGKHKYPESRELFEKVGNASDCQISDGHASYGKTCLDCGFTTYEDPVTNQKLQTGYDMTYWRRTDGANRQWECMALRLKDDPTDPVNNPPLDMLIDRFEKEDYKNMTTHYSTGESSATSCVWEPDQPPCNTTQVAECFTNSWYGITIDNRTVKYTNNVLQASASTFSDFWNYDYPDLKCAPTLETNLYAVGKKGIWRNKKNYYYHDKRYMNMDPDLNLRTDGVYVNDGEISTNRFYFFNWNPDLYYPLQDRWVEQEEVVKYDEGGNPVETNDIYNIPKAAYFSHSNKMAAITASNAEHYQLYFEGADDPDKIPPSGTIVTDPHTGKYSLEYSINSSSPGSLPTRLRPERAESYFVSAWIKYPGASDGWTYNEDGLGVELRFYKEDNSWVSTSSSLKPIGKVIEGWQKIEGVATAPSSSDYTRGKVNFVLTTTSGSNITVQIDDIRVIPNDALAKTYVYNPDTYRLSAQLDENNFATYYHYDEQGQLFLLEKETERGRVTVQESRNHIAE